MRSITTNYHYGFMLLIIVNDFIDYIGEHVDKKSLVSLKWWNYTFTQPDKW